MRQERRFMLFVTANDNLNQEYLQAADENIVNATRSFEIYTDKFGTGQRVRILIFQERSTLETNDENEESEYFRIDQQYHIIHYATPSILIDEFGWPTMRHPQTCRLMDTQPNLSAREQLEEENFVEHLLRMKTNTPFASEESQ